MMDSLMNAPLLFWATEETGDPKYAAAALAHEKTTERYLIREDGSSFHHYQFDPETSRPVRGVTLQGFSDDSCWSRGHSWGVYGFPMAYNHIKAEFLPKVHKDITYTDYILDGKAINQEKLLMLFQPFVFTANKLTGVVEYVDTLILDIAAESPEVRFVIISLLSTALCKNLYILVVLNSILLEFAISLYPSASNLNFGEFKKNKV